MTTPLFPIPLCTITPVNYSERILCQRFVSSPWHTPFLAHTVSLVKKYAKTQSNRAGIDCCSIACMLSGYCLCFGLVPIVLLMISENVLTCSLKCPDILLLSLSLSLSFSLSSVSVLMMDNPNVVRVNFPFCALRPLFSSQS
jgi:hypothetical protein